MFESDLTSKESEILIKFVKQMDKNNSGYMEIGVFTGGSLIKVLENTENMFCWAVDLFEDFKTNPDNTHVTGTIDRIDLVKALRDRGLHQRTDIYKGDSFEYLSKAQSRMFDGVIFIDGNHKFYACLMDFIQSYRILNSGFILFHNASSTYYPDKDYVECDGGPYEVVQIAKKFPNLKYVGAFERTVVFEKEKYGK